MEDWSWMSLRNRTCAEYLDGLKSFVSVAEEDMLNQHKTTIWCPCIDCENEKQYSSSLSVYGHLVMRGFMGDYRCWNKHGEGVNDRNLQAGCMDQGFSGSLHQDDGTHAASKDNEEGPFCSLDLNDDKLADISVNYVQMVENVEEMVRDAMGFGVPT
jgi:hypothetical protein